MRLPQPAKQPTGKDFSSFPPSVVNRTAYQFLSIFMHNLAKIARVSDPLPYLDCQNAFRKKFHEGLKRVYLHLSK
jgi:hypothetical protein